MKSVKDGMILLFPILLSFLLKSVNKYVLTLLCIVISFMTIGFCDCCRKHESLYIYVLVGIVTIRMNIDISLYCCRYLCDILFGGVFFGIAYLVLGYAAVFSIEETVLCVVSRLIWRKQDSLFQEE